jgi:hypothetical protein
MIRSGSGKDETAGIMLDGLQSLDPFNGATRVFLGSAAYDKIVPLMHPFDRRRVAVELRPMMPDWTGVGFRATRNSDPEWQVVPGYGTLVWTLSPRTAEEMGLLDDPDAVDFTATAIAPEPKTALE